MAVAGQLLIQIAADTQDLKAGLNKASSEVKGFAAQVRSQVMQVRQQFRLMNAILSGAGATQLVSGLGRQLEAVAARAKELGEQARAAGMSVSEMTGGRWSDETVQQIGEMKKALDDLADAVMAVAAEFAATLGPIVKEVSSELKEIIANLPKAKIPTTAGEAADQGRRVAETGVATGAPGAGWGLRAGAEWAGGRSVRKSDAQQAEAEEKQREARRQKLIEEQEHKKAQQALDEMKAEERAAEERKKRAAELDKWQQEEEQRKAQAELDAIEKEKKEEEKRQEEKKKRLEEADKWKQEEEQRIAQFELDQMKEEEKALEKEEKERQDKLEKAASIIEGRDGIGSVERGSQAAFSAINRRESKIPQQQLSELKGIRRAVEQGEEETETVEDL